jgi:signal transduction histidine kinase
MEQFASGAAHQLRTPLTRIRGELDLILLGELPDATRGQVQRIQEDLERLSRLCSRLLMLARLDQQSADTTLLNDWVDLQEVVSELLEQTTPLARDRGVDLECHAPPQVRVRGSRPLLVQALLNLLVNGIRYTPRGGSVAVSIDAAGDAVRVTVRDSGPGIPPEERERVFQPFYRLQPAAEADEDGSGLGLAIVKGIARAHGGRVELKEAPGGGSIFQVVLPAAPAA